MRYRIRKLVGVVLGRGRFIQAAGIIQGSHVWQIGGKGNLFDTGPHPDKPEGRSAVHDTFFEQHNIRLVGIPGQLQRHVPIPPAKPSRIRSANPVGMVQDVEPLL